MRLVLSALILAACTGAKIADPAPPPAAPAAEPATRAEAALDPITAAINHSDRPAEDRARDGDRQPDKVLAFIGARPGDTVADLMGGRGYYTELLARVVGPEGRVYAQNNEFVVKRFADGPLTERLTRPGLEHVVRLDAELETPGLPAGSLDAAFMGLFYHDSVWMQTDRAAMNRAIFEALKPGGVFVITDHRAADGRGVEDVKSLHRIEESVVRDELQAAGFVLDAESDALTRPGDDRSVNVFDEAIRGKTDRFVLRFRKPH